LQILANEKSLSYTSKEIKTLILTPTRELAIQIEENFRDYGSSLKLKRAVIF
jgi:ATP-dependent RNA helicase RhlE